VPSAFIKNEGKVEGRPRHELTSKENRSNENGRGRELDINEREEDVALRLEKNRAHGGLRLGGQKTQRLFPVARQKKRLYTIVF